MNATTRTLTPVITKLTNAELSPLGKSVLQLAVSLSALSTLEPDDDTGTDERYCALVEARDNSKAMSDQAGCKPATQALVKTSLTITNIKGFIDMVVMAVTNTASQANIKADKATDATATQCGKTLNELQAIQDKGGKFLVVANSVVIKSYKLERAATEYAEKNGAVLVSVKDVIELLESTPVSNKATKSAAPQVARKTAHQAEMQLDLIGFDAPDANHDKDKDSVNERLNVIRLDTECATIANQIDIAMSLNKGLTELSEMAEEIEIGYKAEITHRAEVKLKESEDLLDVISVDTELDEISDLIDSTRNMTGQTKIDSLEKIEALYASELAQRQVSKASSLWKKVVRLNNVTTNSDVKSAISAAHQFWSGDKLLNPSLLIEACLSILDYSKDANKELPLAA